jgi:hypothetical protein
VREPHLLVLLDALLGERSPTWPALPATIRPPSTTTTPTATACSSTRSASPRTVSTIAATFPGIDRDIAVTGALLHDIGKLDAYAAAGLAIEMTTRQAPGRDRARLLRGAHVRSTAIEGFPPGLAQAVLHVILSHHGALEHGSPVVPCTREATLVHMIDNPRRQARLVRPPREGARRRPAVVGVRPRARAPAPTSPRAKREETAQIAAERYSAARLLSRVAGPWPRTPRSSSASSR